MKRWILLTALSASHHQYEFHIAPMQCYTNQSLRTLFDFLSPSSIKWTEMEKVTDLYPNTRTALEKRLGSIAEPNLVLQLGSNDPLKVQSCASNALKHYEFKEINLNCGCPAIDSGGAPTYGASLMKDVSLTAELVKAVSNSVSEHCEQRMPRTDISVKCRIGVFDHADDLRPLGEQDFRYLKHYIHCIHESGANHVILHARPAILSGLSPVKNRIVPHLDYEFVERIASEFKDHDDLKITLNGGITSISQLERLQQQSTTNGIYSHMAGRWILRRPLDLVGIEMLLSKSSLKEPPLLFSVVERAIENYLDYAVQMLSDSIPRFTTADLCLPLYLVVEQLREDYEADELRDGCMVTYEEMETLYDSISEGIAQIESIAGKSGKSKKKKQSNSINFKRLSTSFKPLVGTKVVNKWKRNRAEL